jgi:hypothetical protein
MNGRMNGCIGSLSLDMYYNNWLIGSATVPDTSMVVGHNAVSMFAILSPQANQTILNDLFTRFLAGQASFIEVHFFFVATCHAIMMMGI